MYYEDKSNDLKQNILYQMKDYTFDFKGDTFLLDIIQEDKEKQTFKIYDCKEGLCAYFKADSYGPYLLKVIFIKDKYEKLQKELIAKILKIGLLLFILLLILSVLFAWYSLKPMREALSLLETFLKDIIHDLNTPVTSILLNSKLLKRRGDFEEIERIELSAKTISSLYKNLDFINPNKIEKDENISVNSLAIEKIEILQKIYPDIEFITNMRSLDVKSNRLSLERIIDNLLTNACKYNKKNGKVFITIEESTLIIEDTGIGIKNISNVFKRYYKENDRGLGIGMSIVKQLCDILEIDILLKSEVNKGTKIKLIF